MRVRALTSGLLLAAAAFAGIAGAQGVGGSQQPAVQPAAQSSAQASAVVVSLDQATIVRLSASASTILVGNPSVAGVQTLDSMTLLITGRSYGRTSLTVLDSQGRLVADTQIVVQAPTAFGMTVYRGTARYSYVCYTTCQAAPIPGDDPGFFDQMMSQASMRSSLAEGR